MEIKIKYHNSELKPMQKIAIGDWIDLRAAEDIELKAGEFKYITLGVSMRLPDGYEAIVVPRSSTFANFGIIQANSVGVIDNSYCGDNDIWGFPALAVRDTHIHINDRICQFRLLKNQDFVEFKTAEHLGDKNRGGFGVTGKD